MISIRGLRPAAVITAAGALAAGLLALAGPASAATLTCGTTVYTSVTLTANLDCSGDTSGTGINVGAPGVTVNLNGYRILGPDAASGSATVAVNDGGYSDVTVEGPGTISNFAVSVGFAAGSTAITAAVVKDLAITSAVPSTSNGTCGVCTSGVDGASISGLTLDDAGTGVFLGGSENVTVTGNRFISPDVAGEDSGGTGDTWSHNTVTGAGDAGIQVDSPSTGVIVRDNTVTGSKAGYGVYVVVSAGTKVMSNSLTGLNAGVIDQGSSGTTVNYNHGTDDSAGVVSEPYATSNSTTPVTGGNYAHDRFSGGEYGAYIADPASAALVANTFDHNSEAGVYAFNDGNGPATVAARLNRNVGDDNRFGLYSTFQTTGDRNAAAGNAVVNCYDVYCPFPGHSAGRPAALPRLALRAPATAIPAAWRIHL